MRIVDNLRTTNLASAYGSHIAKPHLSSILYYITGHGYGHAVRSCQVIWSLKESCAESTVYVRSTVPEWLFEHPLYSVRRSTRSLDAGIVQHDSLEMELQPTLEACKAIHAAVPAVIEEEISFIRQHNIRLIVGDVPPLCFEIAARIGVPSVAITNFSWSGIYRGFLHALPEFGPLIEEMENFYRKTTLALSLPYSCEMDIFRVREMIPFITRSSALDAREARDKFGLPRSATVVLLSFGGHGLERLDLEKLLQQKDFFFVGTGEALRKERNLLILPNAQRNYVDLVRAADVIVSKPGYGIVADVIRHQVPLLYTERGDFAEYPYLVEALQDCATAEFIPPHDLISANLTPYLKILLSKEKHWPTVAVNGASVAAEKVLSLLR
jgi:UDP:flavonoid glycosyltransferase YjiC (YdhE family)